MIAPALPEDEPYLRELEVADIMPRNGGLAVAVRRRYPDGVDALLDNVSHAPGAYDAALKDGARVASPNNAAGEGPGRTNLMAAPTSENLERLAGLLDTGIVNVPIHQAYPLEQAPAAMNALLTHNTRQARRTNRLGSPSDRAAQRSPCDRFRRDSAARTVGPADHISGVSPAPIPRRPSRACCRLPRNARIAGPRRLLRPRERKPRPRSIPCALRTRTRRPRPLDPLGARSGICGTAAAPRGHRVPCNLVARAVARSRREDVAAGGSLAVLAPALQTMCDNVYMSVNVSVRLDDALAERLRMRARAAGESLSDRLRRYAEEGARRDEHPLITFRDGPTGRRAGLVGGPDVWEVSMWVEDLADERDPAAALVADGVVTRAQIDAALRYRAAYPDEIAARIELHRRETAAAGAR